MLYVKRKDYDRSLIAPLKWKIKFKDKGIFFSTIG